MCTYTDPKLVQERLWPSLDMNTGMFCATPRSGVNKHLVHIYQGDLNYIDLTTALRHAFVIPGMTSSDATRRDPMYKGQLCENILRKFKKN